MIQSGEAAIDSQGCASLRVEHTGVKALHFSQSRWFNGTASSAASAGIPLRITVVGSDGAVMADQTASLTTSNTVDFHKMAGDCTDVTVYVSFDAAKLIQWADGLGASIPADNYIFDVGVDTCAYCGN